MDINRDEFWKLLETEHIRARAFCRKLMGNREAGDDLYQDSLVAALHGFERLRDKELFRSWLYKILVNRYKNQVTRSKWRRLLPLTDELRDNYPGDDPEGRYEARRQLEIAFKALNTQDRVLVTLFELEGFTINEICKLNGKSAGSIKVRLSRARRKMRAALASSPQPANETDRKKNILYEDDLCVATKPGRD